MTPLADTVMHSPGLRTCCTSTLRTIAAREPADTVVADGSLILCSGCGTRVVLDGRVWTWDRDQAQAA